MYKLTYKQYGQKAILIEWPALIEEAILYDVIRYKAAILDHLAAAIEDCIVGYHSLTVKYQSFIENFDESRHVLEALYKADDRKAISTSYLWGIPVCYDARFGIDLKEMSKSLKLSEREIIELHANATYTVYFIGFLPGFLYLGGLNERLHLPRKATPRLRVDKGAVAIGGHQTGIYPMQSAGGWHIIGSTPVPLFDLTKEPPCFAKSGDQIKFSPVSLEVYTQIKKMVNQGTYELPKTMLYA